MKPFIKAILFAICLFALCMNFGFCAEDEDVQLASKTYAPGEAKAYDNYCAMPENDSTFEKYTMEKLYSVKNSDSQEYAEAQCEIGLRLIQEYLDKSKPKSERTQLSLIKVFFQPGMFRTPKLPKAVYLTGVCYYLMFKQGDAVEHTFPNAMKYIEEAAEMDYAPAQCQMGMISYYKGDFKKAIEWHKKAALQEYPMSMFEYGMYILEGDHIKRDTKEAAKWFEKAAEKGILRAQFEIGVCYAAGDGVPKNPEKAFKWISKSAEAGHPRSMYIIGIFYIQGEGTEKNVQKGIDWIEKAANANFPEAKKLLEDIHKQMKQNSIRN